jgi:D-glycero-alpha-D-manno-heptose-7-phosphate kinase
LIISQTPYRVSFAGGGTDLPAFYTQESGAVLSVAINQHMYVTVSPRFDASTRVAYTRTEIADTVDEVQHTIVREALKQTGLGKHLEITTVGDVPAGTGLGSSSSLAVGLLNALYAYKGEMTSPGKLAELACHIEIDLLKNPIGRQDQYAAAFGSLNYIEFNQDHSVDVEPVPVRPETLYELEQRVLLFYTQSQRDANEILAKQSASSSEKETYKVLCAMKQLAAEMRAEITGKADLDDFAALLHEGWELKRSIGHGISNKMIDDWYNAARAAGAQGGKLLGAGGGGFLLLMAPLDKHEAIRKKLGYPRELPFNIDRRGSRIIFISDRYEF